MIRDAIDSFLHVLRAPQLLTRYRLWSYAIAPVILTVVLGATLLPLVYHVGDNVGAWMFSWWKWDFASGIVDVVEEWIGRFVLAAGSFFVFKYLILICSGPFMSLLSERMEEQMYGQSETPLTWKSFLRDLIRGLRVNLRNIFREILYTVPLYLLSFIPVVNFVTVPLIFIIQAYFAGFGNMDFAMERHYDVKNSKLFVRQHRGMAIGNGAAFLLLFAIPIVGTLVCMVFSATSASYRTLRLIHAEDSNESSLLGSI